MLELNYNTRMRAFPGDTVLQDFSHVPFMIDKRAGQTFLRFSNTIRLPIVDIHRGKFFIEEPIYYHYTQEVLEYKDALFLETFRRGGGVILLIGDTFEHFA